MIFNGLELTDDAIIAARQHFAGIHDECASGAKGGLFSVYNLDEYVVEQGRLKEQSLNGDFDHTFTFLQMAHYFQTGNCVALLP